MSIELFETRTLTQTVNEVKGVKGFFTQTFFKNVANPTAEHIDIEIIKGKRRMSPFVSPKIAGKVVISQGKRVDTYKPAYIKDKRIFTPDDAIAGQNVVYLDDSNPVQRLATKIATELNDQKTMIDRRIEHMCSQALLTGKINVVGEGVDDVIDFGMDSENIITLTGNALWSDTANSDPRGNLKTWRRKILKDTGIAPDMVVMGTSVVDAYVSHPKVKDSLDTRRIDMGIIDPKQLPMGVTYYGYDKEVGVDIYAYEDWYVNEDDGQEYPFMPVDKVLMACSNAKTVLAYGLIRDLQSLYATKLFTKSWEQEDPSARYVLTQSAPLPIPSQIGCFVVAKAV